MISKSYSNPRMDHNDGATRALSGTVSLDPNKALWVSAMFIFGTLGSALTASWGAVVLCVVTTLVSLCFGHSLGMHRRFIHRSYTCPMWMEYAFVHLGVLVGLAGPLGMLKTHDLRDWAQRQSACHDFFAHQQVWYRDMYWQLLCSIQLSRAPVIEIEPQIAEDRVYYWMEHTWKWQQLPWAILFYAVGGWGFVFWGVCTRVSLGIFGHWLVGYFAHNSGGKSWHVEGAAVQGYNVPFTAFLTMGESWHNNHHAFPGSARLGLLPGQWDPGWWVLLGLQRCGLVTDVVTPGGLAWRPELRELATESYPYQRRLSS